MNEEITVKSRHLRISPKKAIPHARKFKNKKIDQAYDLIQVTDNKFSQLFKKLLDSGVAAANEEDLDEDKLKIKQVVCNQGPTMKRRLIRSRGRADIIKKRTSHLVLTLEEMAYKQTEAEDKDMKGSKKKKTNKAKNKKNKDKK